MVDIHTDVIDLKFLRTVKCNNMGFFSFSQEVDIVPSGVPELLQDLSSMINNSFLSDVMIKLQDGQEMVAHSFILALRSEVLAQVHITYK